MKAIASTRRELLRAAARWAVVAGTVGGAAAMMARKGDACVRPVFCGSCPLFSGCGLPRARDSRSLERKP